MSESVDGFFTAFLTGKAGSGFSMFVIRKGKLVGSDMLGAVYDGRIEQDGADAYKVILGVRLPPNLPLIQGGMSGPFGDTYEMSFNLPHEFTSQSFVRIDTKHGPLNAKIVKIRALDD
ncbi:hypothetical protein [Methylocystis sp. B8]|uniref:hypothetical protein n=1 Tax=Methylocystis sp. B8 TaxID=544938 RepID=UPI0010FEC83B|nr:hypothetical protein [Methylocystis sp. B8]TLG75162.1 hypothetical protein FEV16_11680 [Methylocystis sp. B8]